MNTSAIDINKLFLDAGLRAREAQTIMIEAVQKTLTDGTKIVIEAPTATGKSFAYILGALLANYDRTQKGQSKLSIIISTATVALQEQLIDKDLPFIHHLLKDHEIDFSYQLAKGRSRYLCLRKLHNLNPSEALSGEAERLDEQFNTSWSGDFDLLEKPVSPQLLSEIRNTSTACSFSRCEYYQECPFFVERQGLRKKDVIIVNHSLLISHLDLGDGAILPKFEDSMYIIDECHHLPDRALKSLAGYASLLGSHTWIGDVDKLLNSLPGELASQKLRDNWRQVNKNLTQQLTTMQQIIAPLYQQAQKEEEVWRVTSLNDDFLKLATEIKISTDFYVTQCENLKKQLDDFIEKNEIYSEGSLSKQFTQLGFLLERSVNLQNVWSLMINQKTAPPIAKWVVPHGKLNKESPESKKDKKQDESLAQSDLLGMDLQDYDIHASPIEAASLLKAVFWKNVVHGVVLCSATVRSIGKFDRFLNSTALKKEAKTLLLDSPLNYEKSRIIIADINCEPTDQERHIDETAKLLNTKYLHDIEKGALVLFTSIFAMERVYTKLAPAIKRITLVQGDRSKQAIIALHKKRIDGYKPSVIFGVDSFSEGVDLPDNYLTRLIIHKLPFSVPTNPIDRTRAEWLSSINRNSFMDISLPQASLKLTQMVGRLIRSETDVGEVIILDKRLQTKRYGKQLIDNLPPFQRI